MHGRPVENARHSIHLFSMCEQMKWNHLPVAGGLYDQHPQLLEEFKVIFDAKARKEEKEREAEKRKADQERKRGGRRRGR